MSDETKAKLNIVQTVTVTSTLALIPAIVGPIVGMNGGDILPWVVGSVVIYAIEFTYLAAVAVREYKHPEQERQRTLRKRRRNLAKTVST